METHYHRCGECGMVWGHPDAELGERTSEEFTRLHTCPRGCPGRWTEHYEPKRISRETLAFVGACDYGIRNILSMVGALNAFPVSKEIIDKIDDDYLEEAASWAANLLRHNGSRDTLSRYLASRFEVPHEGIRCRGCEYRLMMFVRLYNED